MCIITAEEAEADIQRWLKISKTNIFARHTRPGFQAIVYSMSIASSTQAAMILPLPVSSGSSENALTFIDLSGYPDFFEDLFRGCQNELESLNADFDSSSSSSIDTLQVHEVGDYEASYVPSMADFNRLDARFRLPGEVWKKMPDYSGYGFAVFQLKIALANSDNKAESVIHPMAFEFQTKNSDTLFYPTVHVHDGDYHQKADFFHMFYCQRDNARMEFKHQRDLLQDISPTSAETSLNGGGDEDMLIFDGYGWFYSSREAATEVMQINKCQGVIAPDKKIYAMSLHGHYPNRDIWLGNKA